MKFIDVEKQRHYNITIKLSNVYVSYKNQVLYGETIGTGSPSL